MDNPDPVTEPTELSTECGGGSCAANSAMEQTKQEFERTVVDKVQANEKSIQEALRRAESELDQRRLALCLYEHRLALSLDPNHLEYEQQLRQASEDLKQLTDELDAQAHEKVE